MRRSATTSPRWSWSSGFAAAHLGTEPKPGRGHLTPRPAQRGEGHGVRGGRGAKLPQICRCEPAAVLIRHGAARSGALADERQGLVLEHRFDREPGGRWVEAVPG